MSVDKNVSIFRVSELTGYEPQDLIEKTLYNFVHTSEMSSIRLSHQTCKDLQHHNSIPNILITL